MILCFLLVFFASAIQDKILTIEANQEMEKIREFAVSPDGTV